MSQFFYAKLEKLAPYMPGEQPQDKKYVKLNTNESPYAPSPKVAEAVQRQVQRLNLYCDPQAGRVTALLAETLGLLPRQVFVGNGSDEILAFCFQALCRGGAAFADITYGFYPVFCGLYGVQAQIIPLKEDFSLAPEEYASLGKTIFIANPNAPTGLALTPGQVETILQANRGSLVVIDEAYVDFGAESAVPLLGKYDNLLVVGTFSKSRQLAGGRFGYAAGSEELINDLKRIKNSFNPYNVNSMTQAAAAESLDDKEYFAACRDKVMATRALTLRKLRGMDFACTESLANFVFCSHAKVSAQQIYEGLREKGVLVRWWKLPRIQNHLRISIGTPEDMDVLFAALERVLAGN